MSLLVHIKNFINAEGMRLVPEWFEKSSNYAKQQEGFMSLKYALDPQDATCLNLWLEFKDEKTLMQWIQAPVHVEVISLLDPYRTQAWQAVRYEVKASVVKAD